MNIIFYILIGIVILILLICLAIASYAGAQVVETFEEVNKSMSSSFITASDFSSQVSKGFLRGRIMVGRREGHLTDAYIPSRKTIFLSDQVFANSSLAALAIAAHELGHAQQDIETPEVLKRREKLGLLSKILGFFMLPFLILGIVFFFVFAESIILSLLFLGGAILIFVLALCVKLVTIKIEKDASKNALNFLRTVGGLREDEIVIANKLLKAALLTYIADFLRAVLGWTMLTKKTKLFGS